MDNSAEWYYQNKIQLDRDAQYHELVMSTIRGLRPKFGKDGNMFFFLLGENLQEGVAAFGSTVNEAAYGFYGAYCNERIPQQYVETEAHTQKSREEAVELAA